MTLVSGVLAKRIWPMRVGTTANTVSRWEMATYKPAISDLERLARYFGVSIAAFFPEAIP